MSVNFGAGVAAAPNQPNVDGAPPPQQPLAPAHHPSVTTVAAAVSLLNAPPVDDSPLSSSNPMLASRASFHAAMNKLSADWASVEKAIREGDLQRVHRMLDQGLLPCVILEDESGQTVSTSFPDDLFEHLHDIELFDRLIDLFTRHDLQSELNGLTMQTANSSLLKRLAQSNLEGWRCVSSGLERLLSSAIVRQDAKQLDGLLKLKKELFSTAKLKWDRLWFDSSRSLSDTSGSEGIAVLVSHTKPSEFSHRCVADMFYRAAEAGDDRLVRSLVEWLGDDTDAFFGSSEWESKRYTLSIDGFTTIVKGGFPQEGMSLPPPKQTKAQEFQLILYGPTLSRSPFAHTVGAADASPNAIINFVFCKSLDVTKGPFLNDLSLTTQLRYEGHIATDLFRSGLAAPLAIKLARKTIDFLSLSRLTIVSGAHGLSYLAYLNECLHPDALSPLEDSLSIAQAKIIHDASLAVLEEQFGGPIGFYSRALACIKTDGSIDISKLSLIYQRVMGLPAKIVQQISATLKTLCAEVLTSALPLNLFKPGMTGAEFQAAFHRWIQQGVAQRIVNQLPRDLGLGIAKRDWNDLPNIIGTDSDDENYQVQVAELISPVNYLVTSLINQYSENLAENIEANSERMVEACRALPPDAFQPIRQDDTDLDTSDNDSSSTDEDSDQEST